MEIFDLKSCSFQENTDNRIIILILNPPFKIRVKERGGTFEYYEPKFVIPVDIEEGRIVVALEDALGTIVGGPWFDCEFEEGVRGWWTLLLEERR